MDELWSRVAVAVERLRAGAPARLVRAVTTPVRRPLRRVGARLTPRGRLPTAVAEAAGRAQRILAGERPPVLYRDDLVTLDRDGVLIRAYYLPVGRRRIAYEDIRAVEPYPLSGGRAYRVHGYAWPRQWYHRDRRRGERSLGLLLRTDAWLWPVLTPADPMSVRELLQQRIRRRHTAGEGDGPAPA